MGVNGLPGPSNVANLTSDDGTVILTQYQGGRVVDLSVPAPAPTPADITFGGETLGGDVPLPNGTTTDLGLSLSVLEGETWLISATVNIDPGIGAVGVGVQALAQIGNAALVAGSESASLSVVVSATLFEQALTFTGIWAVTAGNDTIKLQAISSGDDSTATRHDNEFGHSCTGFTAIRLVAAA
jgi:hypothetical protein